MYYDREKPVMVTIPDVQAAPELSADELAIERAWQNYYRTIAIPSRKNERCDAILCLKILADLIE